MTAAGALLPLVPFAAALIGLLLPRGSRIVPAALGIGAAAVALAVVLQLYRLRQSVAVDEVPLAEEEDRAPAEVR